MSSHGAVRNLMMKETWPKTFSESFCAKFSCPTDAYESKVLWRCFSFRLGLLGRILNRCKPKYFELDRSAIRRLGAARSDLEFEDELQDLYYVERRDGSFLRRNLKIRVSISKLRRLKAQLFD